ncbi:MAG: hypothetical protein WC915_01965 [archaeon]|jgi:hypothetical protein
MLKVTKNTIIEEKDGIVFVKVKDEDFDLEGMAQHLKVCYKDSQGIAKPVLMDLSDLDYISTSATNYALESEECNKMTKALAMLINSPTMKIQLILTAILKFKKPPYPVKIFFSYKKAIDWLNQFKNEDLKK